MEWSDGYSYVLLFTISFCCVTVKSNFLTPWTPLWVLLWHRFLSLRQDCQNLHDPSSMFHNALPCSLFFGERRRVHYVVRYDTLIWNRRHGTTRNMIYGIFAQTQCLHTSVLYLYTWHFMYHLWYEILWILTMHEYKFTYSFYHSLSLMHLFVIYTASQYLSCSFTSAGVCHGPSMRGNMYKVRDLRGKHV